VAEADLVSLFLENLEGVRRVLAAVGSLNDVVVGSASNVTSGELERQLRVAVDGDVNEVGDGDGLNRSSGAGEKGDGGELHVDDWYGSESAVVG
jgi:hypothetical protein